MDQVLFGGGLMSARGSSASQLLRHCEAANKRS